MKKILIVEDDQIVANIYRNKFSVEGFEVEVALDGEAGLSTVRSFRPDAVILDLMLPKVTGIDLMKQIRAEPGFEKVPVIVFSNTYLTNLVQDAWKAGATKCLSKANCSPKQVLEVVRSTLSINGTPTNGASPTQTKTASPTSHAHSSSAPIGSPSTKEADADAEFQADLRRTFLTGLPSTLATLRGMLQHLIKGEDETARLKYAHDLYRRVHALTGNAAMAGMDSIAQVADALEALLKELYEKPKQMTASTLRTVASAVDFLAVLFDRGAQGVNMQLGTPSILVVDDEAISRRAVVYALEKAKLKSVSIEDPVAALKMLSERKFDLIFLDVDMPGMNGFELCTKLRGLAAHKKTPVVFVTSLNDFESRTNSTVSGGNDFIAKPFLFIELAVKSVVHLYRARLAAGK